MLVMVWGFRSQLVKVLLLFLCIKYSLFYFGEMKNKERDVGCVFKW